MLPSPAPVSARASGALAVAAVALDAVLVVGVGSESPFGQWWTSVGLWAVALAVSGPRRWAALLVTMAVAGSALRFGIGGDPWPVLGGTGVRLAEALVAAAVLTRGGRAAARLDRVGDLRVLVTAAVAAGVVSAAQVGWHAPAVTEPVRDGLVENFCQHALSVLVLGALVLAARQTGRPRWSRREVVGLAVQVAVLVGVTALVLGGDSPLLFLPVPALVWAALRWPPVVAAAEVVGYAGVVTTLTASGWGPMRAELVGADQSGPIVLAYIGSVIVLVLPLAVAQHQRRGLVDRLASDEHLFRRNFTESPLGMLLLHGRDGDLVVADLNAAAGTILGAGTVPGHDLVAGRRLAEVIDTYDPVDRGLAALLAGRADSWHGHGTALRRPGSRLEVAIAALDGRDGSRVYSAQLLDVTQEHEAHRRLVAAHRLNDATLDTAACIILVADAAGTVVRVNAATTDITGYATADLVGHQVWTTPLGALARAETEAMFVWPNRSGYPMVTERVGRTAEGEPLRLVWSNNVVRDEQGQPSYAVLTGIDVTAERASTGLMTHLLSASIATALIGVDGAGRITLFNAGAAHMLGWTATEMIGQPFVDLFDTQQVRSRTGSTGDHDSFHSLVGMIGDRDESPARDWTWRTRTGHELIVSMTLSVTEDLGEDRVGFLCVGRDVTEQREGQELLVAALDKERTAVERLRDLDRAKDEFVSTVSHELRTPVTSILGYAEMLRDGSVVDPVPDQLPVLDRIARNAERLVTICNDLLLLSGFDAGAPTQVGVHTRVDLRACVVGARELAAGWADGRDVEVRVRPGGVPLEVTGDRAQLDRVVANLVGNAIKFTPAGGRVDVELDHDDGRAVLLVRDTGIGIPAADHEAVFQRFYRTVEAQQRAIPGTGLGLPIVAAVVAAHHGTIELDSEPGLGTTFRVLLPLTDRDAVASRPAQGPELTTSG